MIYSFHSQLTAKKWLFISLIQLAIVFSLIFEFLKISNQNFLLTVFDVPNGDAMLIKTPEGHNLIVDTGVNSQITSEIFKKKSFFNRTIDGLIITHPHEDHLGGVISLMDQFEINALFLSGAETDNGLYAEIIKKALVNNIPINILNSKTDLNLGTVKLDVIYPINNIAGNEIKNLNNSSLVIKINVFNEKILLTGDAEKEVENKMTLSDVSLKSDYLKIGHQGSKTSSTEIFLDAVAPKIAIIPAGAENQFGHPHQEVLDRLKDNNIKTYITRETGNFTIEISPNSEINNRF